MLHELLPYAAITPPVLYGAISILCARNFFRTPILPGLFQPPVTILKPVKGIDAKSYDNFAGFCRQNYTGYQIIFAVAGADDPVIPVIRRLMTAFPEVDIELVIDATIHGPNYKVCNLINAFPKVKYDIIIVCDSDIRVGPEYLSRISHFFADPAVGLVTSLYRSPTVSGAAAAVEAIGFTAEMIPNVMVAVKLEGLSFALGASMAVRREALASIGGFESLVDYLADDYQLGNKIHRAGYKLELSADFVESVMHRENVTTILARQLRWARTMRVSRPGGYLASGITQPFAAVCMAIMLSGFSLSSVPAILLLYLLRSLMVTLFSRQYVKDNLFPRWLFLLPLRDFSAFATWLLSFFGRTVHWRGYKYRLLSGGRMILAEGKQ